MQNLIKSINSLSGLKLVPMGNGSAIVTAKNLGKLMSLIDGSSNKARLSEIALKAVATRRANKVALQAQADKRSEAARKANVTRKFAKTVQNEITNVIALRQPGTPMFKSPITSPKQVAAFNSITSSKARAMTASKSQADILSERANKAWETRRANALASKRSNAALKAWKTRRTYGG